VFGGAVEREEKNKNNIFYLFFFLLRGQQANWRVQRTQAGKLDQDYIDKLLVSRAMSERANHSGCPHVSTE
jgi:hypothetical protein